MRGEETLTVIPGPIEPALHDLDVLSTPAQVVAVCAYGSGVFAKPGVSTGDDLLVLCDGYANGLRAHLRIYDGREVRFLIAERTLVESDVERGTLGDYLTEQFLYPHKPIVNREYLDSLAIKARARVAKEEAHDLVLELGEMCHGLLAYPEFFGLSRMRKLARVFIPSMTSYLRLLEEPVRGPNLSFLRASFKSALTTNSTNLLTLDGEYASFDDAAIDSILETRVSGRVVNVFRQSERALYSYLSKGRALFLSPDLLSRELLSPLKLVLDPALARTEPQDPKEFLFLRTSEGLVSLAEKVSLDGVIAHLELDGPVTITPLAGVLNEVFLITAGKQQLVAKKFTDWHGFKWFTLNLVALGSKLFSVSGKARMTNEYGMNRYLAKKGVNVPSVVYLSVNQRILVERYVNGISLGEYARDAVNEAALSSTQVQVFESLGATVAEIHRLGVSIGDSKPENFVCQNSEIFVVDLEQAGKRADYSWDIAELLFYTGHYNTRPTATRALLEMTEAFTRGYLRRGRAEELRKAAGVRHAKVFSIWTPAPVILEISRLLRSAK